MMSYYCLGQTLHPIPPVTTIHSDLNPDGTVYYVYGSPTVVGNDDTLMWLHELSCCFNEEKSLLSCKIESRFFKHWGMSYSFELTGSFITLDGKNDRVFTLPNTQEAWQQYVTVDTQMASMTEKMLSELMTPTERSQFGQVAPLTMDDMPVWFTNASLQMFEEFFLNNPFSVRKWSMSYLTLGFYNMANPGVIDFKPETSNHLYPRYNFNKYHSNMCDFLGNDFCMANNAYDHHSNYNNCPSQK